MNLLDKLLSKVETKTNEQFTGIQERGDGIYQNGRKVIDPTVIARKSNLVDPMMDLNSNSTFYKERINDLPVDLITSIATSDSIVRLILAHRRTQLEPFGRPQHARLSPGFALVRRDKREIRDEDMESILLMTEFLNKCGYDDNLPVRDKYTFSDFIGQIITDAQIYGYACVEKVLDQDSSFYCFRHVPASSVYHVNLQLDSNSLDQYLSNYYGIQEGLQSLDPSKPYWVQRTSTSANPCAFFSEDTLIFKYYQPSNYMNKIYGEGMIEKAVNSIKDHLNNESYNRLRFSQSALINNLIHFKGAITDTALQNFRNNWNQSLIATNNSHRQIIISTQDVDIQRIPLSDSNKDMELIRYTEHVIRIMCAAFLINPAEIGFENLSNGGQITYQNKSNEDKIMGMGERGLKSLMIYLENLVNNDILPCFRKDLSEIYYFTFVGLNSETPMAEASRLQMEQSVHASMNNLLRAVGKKSIDEGLGADIPLNQAYLSLLRSTLTVGEIREKLFGIKDDSKNPSYNYIADGFYLQNRQMIQAQEQQQQAQQQQVQQQQVQQQQQAQQQAQAKPTPLPIIPPPQAS